jgi:hypothetical protein
MIEDIFDIKPPVALAAWAGWWWIGAAGLLALLLGLAIWQARRTAPDRRIRRTLARAMRRLEAASPGLDDRMFAYRLADLLRQGIARRIGLATASLTTEEVLPRLAATDLPEDLRAALATALRRCDQARYAAPPDGVAPPHLHRDLAPLRQLLGRNRPWPF